MELTVERFSDNGQSTLGLLFIDGIFECYTLEDTYRPVKVANQTRIPAGRYPMALRTEGGMYERYKNSPYPQIKNIFVGSLWIQNIPFFEWILIHCGNSDADTGGCLLVGDLPNNNRANPPGWLGDSVAAYVRVYPKVVAALQANVEVWITYLDRDRE